MKKFRKGLVCIYLCSLCIVSSAQTTITLDASDPSTGREEHVASQEIILEPSYEFTPGSNDFLWAYIDDRIPGQPTYKSLWTNTDLDNRTIDLTLDVGRVPGNHSVSSFGAGAYSVPLNLPKATKNLEPELSINYNSQSGNGILGLGWSLNGLSSITRVSKNIFHDGKVQPIKMDNSDVFILDGQRFYPTASNLNGLNGTEYELENQDYSKITSHEQSGSGPKWFKVVTKDGITMEFGKSFRSTLPESGNTILIWNLSRVIDQNGNYIEYVYKTDNYQLRLHEIKYTGNLNEGIIPYNSVKFYYNFRDDKNTSYIANTKVKSNYLLHKIEVESDGLKYKTYEFLYGIKGVSFLNEIIEKGSKDGKLNSTLFKYELDEYEVTEQSTLHNFNTKRLVNGDFNGDGIGDILKLNTGLPVCNACGILNRYVSSYELLIGNGSGTSFSSSGTYSFGSDEVSPGKMASQVTSNNPNLGDFNGDGLMDFATYILDNSGSELGVKEINLYLSTGTSFTKKIINVDQLLGQKMDEIALIGLDMNQGGYTANDISFLVKQNKVDVSDFFTIGDFNGDGISDIFLNVALTVVTAYSPTSRSQETFNVNVTLKNLDVINSGFSFIQNGSTNFSINGSDADIRISSIEFNGDGRSELLVVNSGTSFVYDISENWPVEYYADGYPSIWQKLRTGDFNGDGISDFLSFINNSWTIGYGTGAGWHEVPFTPSTDISLDSDQENLVIADFDGDGKSDIGHGKTTYSGYPTASASNKYHIYLSTGRGFSHSEFVLADEISYANSAQVFGNYFGTSRLQMLYSHKPSVNSKLVDFNFKNTDKMLQRIKDGYNFEVKFEYSNMSESSVYSKGTGALDPIVNFLRPIPLVERVISENGVGGDVVNEYKYENGLYHREGLGLLGLQKTTTIEVNNDKRIETEYELDSSASIFLMFPKYSRSYKNSTDELLSENVSYFSVANLGNHSWEVNLVKTESKDLIKDWITSEDLQYDIYGNVLSTAESIDLISGGNVTNTVTMTQYVDDSNGPTIPYLPLSTQTTFTRSGEVSYTRKSEFTYSQNGNLLTSTSDPNKAKAVTISLSYDNFGNTISKTSSANSLSSMVENNKYDNKGRFLIEVIDPLNGKRIFENHKLWGAVTREIDPSGKVISNKYDEFGRLTETIALGNGVISTSFDWDIVTGSYSPNAPPSLSFSVFKLTTTTTNRPTKIIWYDKLSRVVKSSTEHPSGQLLVELTSYDEIGRIHKVTEPYFNGQSAQNITEYHFNDPYHRVTKVENSLQSLSYTYNVSNGLYTTIRTSGAGQMHSTSIDASGKIVKTADHGGELIYGYFSSGLPKATSLNGSQIVSIEYDEYDRQTKLIETNSGTTLYDYDAFGRLISQTDANLNNRLFTYDLAGKVTSETGTEGTTTFSYYTNGNAINAIKNISGPNGYSIDYKYNNYGHVSLKKESIGAEVFETRFEYNNQGENTAIIYPSGHRIEYTYIGSKIDLVKDGSGKLLFSNSTVNKFGKYSSYKLGNGLITTNIYDQYGYLEAMKVGSIFDMEYDFDQQTGNLLKRTDNINSLVETFTYDNLDRFSSMKLGLANPKTMAYSSSSNKYHETDLGFTSIYDDNQQKNITQFHSLCRTNNQDVTYTAFDRVETIEEEGYELTLHYGPLKDRKKSELKHLNVLQTTKYFLGNYEKIVSQTSTDEVHYIDCGGGVIVMYVISDGTSQYFYSHSDYLGSILTVTKDDGTVEYSQNFDAWGRNRNPTNWSYDLSGLSAPPSWLTRGYTGHEHLYEFTLVNMNNRMYDQETGRMLSVDNFVSNPLFTQAYNRYTYANNNPLKYTDPNGEWVHIVAGAVIGGVINVATNWSSISEGGDVWSSVGKGAAFFGVGAGAGAVTAATGSFAAGGAIIGGGNAALNGGGAQEIIVGTAAGAIGGALGGAAGGYVSSRVGGGIIGGALSGMSGGAVGGFSGSLVYGIGNGVPFGQNISNSLQSGGQGMLWGGVIGGAMGGYSVHRGNRGIDPVYQRNSMWDGRQLGPARNQWSMSKNRFTPNPKVWKTRVAGGLVDGVPGSEIKYYVRDITDNVGGSTNYEVYGITKQQLWDVLTSNRGTTLGTKPQKFILGKGTIMDDFINYNPEPSSVGMGPTIEFRSNTSLPGHKPVFSTPYKWRFNFD